MEKTLYINPEELLNWIFEHKLLTEDFFRRFDPDKKGYTRIQVAASDYYPIGEEEWNY